MRRLAPSPMRVGRPSRTAPHLVSRQLTYLTAIRTCSTLGSVDGTSSPARQAPLSASPPSNEASSPPPRHPMELLSAVFQAHPSALRLHRELTIALAHGDSEQAADLASVLASTVRRVTEEWERGPSAQAAGQPVAASSGTEDTLPPPITEDVQEAIEKTRATLESAHQQRSGTAAALNSNGAAPDIKANGKGGLEPFWRNPDKLCITLLESAFETDVPYENASPLTNEGRRAEQCERQEMEILDEYLTKEAARWKQQKAAVLHAVLTVAKELGLTPEEVHVHESGTSHRDAAASAGHLNVLKHANLLIRGEVPSLAFAQDAPGADASVTPQPLASAKSELAVLKSRMAEQGTPLSPVEEEMALYELVMAKSTVRYLVGLHHDLESAVNGSDGVRRAWTDTHGKFPTPAAFFVSRVMEALHPSLSLDTILSSNPTAHGGSADADADERVALNTAIATPVLPFTFMLKTCLWFTPESEEGSAKISGWR